MSYEVASFTYSEYPTYPPMIILTHFDLQHKSTPP